MGRGVGEQYNSLKPLDDFIFSFKISQIIKPIKFYILWQLHKALRMIKGYLILDQSLRLVLGYFLHFFPVT